MAENITNLGKDIHLEIQETAQTSNRRSPPKFIPRHSTITFLKTKDNKKTFKKKQGDMMHYAIVE